jgi:multiple RNA-binding domain-containing protein 1
MLIGGRDCESRLTSVFLVGCSEDELAAHFGRFGELSQVHVVLDKTTKRSKGLAYILYMFPEAAVRAMEELDKSIFQGRLLHILPAKRPPAAPEPKQAIHAGPGTTKYKQEREEQRKVAEASGHTQAWNPLFMRPDTVWFCYLICTCSK